MHIIHAFPSFVKSLSVLFLILISNETLSFELRTLRVRAAWNAAPSHQNAARSARSKAEVFDRVRMTSGFGAGKFSAPARNFFRRSPVQSVQTGRDAAGSRTGIHKRRCRMGEGFPRQARRFDAGILFGFQGKAMKSDGKRPVQTALTGCGYTFYNMVKSLEKRQGCFSAFDYVIQRRAAGAARPSASAPGRLKGKSFLSNNFIIKRRILE